MTFRISGPNFKAAAVYGDDGGVGGVASTIGGARPVVVQLGALIKLRNLKLGQVLAEWGDCKRKEFRQHVEALGVEAEADEINAVFDELDGDGGGSLDNYELRTGLKKLCDAAQKAELAANEMRKAVSATRKVAVQQQAAVLTRQRERQEAQSRAAADAARLRQEREAEAATAAAAARTEKEALEARRAEEKAAKASLVAERRGAMGGAKRPRSPSALAIILE